MVLKKKRPQPKQTYIQLTLKQHKFELCGSIYKQIFFFPVNICTVFNLQLEFHGCSGLSICEFWYLQGPGTKLLRIETILCQSHSSNTAWPNVSHLIETQK